MFNLYWAKKKKNLLEIEVGTNEFEWKLDRSIKIKVMPQTKKNNLF